ncbi:branched-chain amino acid ABC transporter permease [bacterium]|nr:branched-chain amino acid ABC transporter permease [bacterium]
MGCNGQPMNAGTLLEQLLIGLILGSVYAVIALGYTLVYGVIKLINFAHSDVYMVGAFLGYYLLRFFIRWLHFDHGISLVWCFIFSVLLSSGACAVLSVVIERLAYRPLRKSTRIAALITAVGVSFFLENLGIIAFGANPKSYEPKTLPVYQLQLSADASFSSPEQFEVRELSQKEFPAARFDSVTFARVRLLSPRGESDWGPALEVDPGQNQGFVELPAQAKPPEGEGNTAAAGVPAAPASIGFSRSGAEAERKLVLSWREGDPKDVQLNPVFSDSEGRQLSILLPLRNAGGEQVKMPVFSLVILGVSIALLGGLNWLIHHSNFGICMRALSHDLNAAKLMGVNTDLVISQTFALGGACAAVAGNLVGLYNQTIDPLMGILPGLKAFIAAVVGGIGSIPGAAVGGLIMGLSEAAVKTFIPPQYSALADAMAFAILIVVLLFKPSGLFGRAIKEKV